MLNYMGGAGFHIIFAHANLFFFRTNLYYSDTKRKKKLNKEATLAESVNEFYKRLGKFMNERLKQI